VTIVSVLVAEKSRRFWQHSTDSSCSVLPFSATIVTSVDDALGGIYLPLYLLKHCPIRDSIRIRIVTPDSTRYSIWTQTADSQVPSQAAQQTIRCWLETLVVYLALEASCHHQDPAAASSVCKNHQTLSDRHLWQKQLSSTRLLSAFDRFFAQKLYISKLQAEPSWLCSKLFNWVSGVFQSQTQWATNHPRQLAARPSLLLRSQSWDRVTPSLQSVLAEISHRHHLGQIEQIEFGALHTQQTCHTNYQQLQQYTAEDSTCKETS